jgi:hypothetical protein
VNQNAAATPEPAPAATRPAARAGRPGRRMLILVAKQRSGTHAMTRLLGSSPDVRNLGEVFFAFAKMLPGTYFEYRQIMIRRMPRLAFPSIEHQAELWEGYCAMLEAQHSEAHLLLDVKYNSWHHFNAIWQNPSDPPEMVRLVRKRGLPVLHLIRRNKFSQACSEHIALVRKVWDSSQNRASAAQGPIVIPPKLLQTQMNKSKAETELFRQHFAGYEHYAELVYEDMFEHNRLSADAQRTVESLTGQAGLGEGLETPLRKVITNLRETVGNADELVEYFSTTRWAGQVREALNAADAPRTASVVPPG